VVAQGYDIALISVFSLDILSDGTWHHCGYDPHGLAGLSSSSEEGAVEL
jgi:hypothetical protein